MHHNSPRMWLSLTTKTVQGRDDVSLRQLQLALHPSHCRGQHKQGLTSVVAEVLQVGLLSSDPDGGHERNQDDQDHESHHRHEPDLLT